MRDRTKNTSDAVKRPYREVRIAPVASGFAVLLDAKPLKTPAGRAVVLPTHPLAEAIAAEWAAQGERLALDRLPLTRIAATALDRLPGHRRDIEVGLMAYAETELVCHRADHPPALAARQHAVWQPLLDWLTERFAAPLAVTHGVVAHPQPEASLERLSGALAGYDDWRLAALAVAVSAAGSLVVGLALAEARIDADGAFAAAELDAIYEMEQWGDDPEAARRQAGVRADLEAAARFLALCRVT